MNQFVEEPLLSIFKRRILIPIKDKTVNIFKYCFSNCGVENIITFGSLTYMIGGYLFLKDIRYECGYIRYCSFIKIEFCNNNIFLFLKSVYDVFMCRSLLVNDTVFKLLQPFPLHLIPSAFLLFILMLLKTGII